MHKKESMSLYLQSPRLNQMNILREVAADAHITQAELAARCSLSVAMVNNYMKELCRVGLMEYHRRTIKSVTYHLTLAGAERLEMLQQELMRDMVGMFVASKEQILARILSHAPGTLRRVILFGRNHLAQLVFHALDMAEVNILGICEDDIDLVGSDFCGREVMNPSQLRFLSPDAVIVARTPSTDEVFRNLDSLSARGVRIVRLDGSSSTKHTGRSEAKLPVILSGEVDRKTAVAPLSISRNH